MWARHTYTQTERQVDRRTDGETDWGGKTLCSCGSGYKQCAVTL